MCEMAERSTRTEKQIIRVWSITAYAEDLYKVVKLS